MSVQNNTYSNKWQKQIKALILAPHDDSTRMCHDWIIKVSISGMDYQQSVEGEYSRGDVVEHPVHAFQQVLSRDGRAPHDAPMVRLYAVQL